LRPVFTASRMQHVSDLHPKFALRPQCASMADIQSATAEIGEEKKKQIELECGPMPNVMAAQPNIGGALCECSAIPFLVPRHKVRLTAAVRVPCSHTANIGKRKTWELSEFCSWQNSAREQEPSEMYICSVPAQKTAKHRAKFDWPPVSDIAALTKPRREIG